MRHFIIYYFIFSFLCSCTVSERKQRAIKYSVQGGINQGGITENTDLSVVSGLQEKPESNIDAYSGATQTGFNVGAHINIPLRFGDIGTGIDYMFNHQTFLYANTGNGYCGERKFGVNQLMLPFTYNLSILKKALPDSEIQLKIGFLGQINMINIKESGRLPDYTLKNWSNGATLGLSAYPFRFHDGSKLGFYLDIYRGSRIYTDIYNQEDFEMPGSSFVKFGLTYQFRFKTK